MLRVVQYSDYLKNTYLCLPKYLRLTDRTKIYAFVSRLKFRKYIFDKIPLTNRDDQSNPNCSNRVLIDSRSMSGIVVDTRERGATYRLKTIFRSFCTTSARRTLLIFPSHIREASQIKKKKKRHIVEVADRACRCGSFVASFRRALMRESTR